MQTAWQRFNDVGNVKVEQSLQQFRIAHIRAEQDCTANGQHTEPADAVGCQPNAGHSQSTDIVDVGGDEDEKQKPVVPEAVEEIAGDQKQVILTAVGQAPVAHDDEG